MQGFLQGTANLVLGIAIPIHMQMCNNALVTDYVPMAARGGCGEQANWLTALP